MRSPALGKTLAFSASMPIPTDAPISTFASAPDRDDTVPPSAKRVIPPPPRTSITDLRLSHPTLHSDLPEYVWGQGDAYAIPRIPAPPSDLTEINPELRDTVRPGRLTA
jgi:hypothetical protein